MHIGEVLLDGVEEPEILEGEQGGDIDFVPESVVEQEQEIFHEAGYYGEQGDEFSEAEWDMEEGDCYEGEENLSPFLLF